MLKIQYIGFLNNFSAIYQVLSSLVIIIVVLVNAKKSNAVYVFTDYENGTGYAGNMGYVLLIGLLSTLFTFSGYEAGGHIAEETVNASKSAPRGIFSSCLVGAIVGIVYILGLLFAINPEAYASVVASGSICTLYA